jgi:uncharacterized phage infection (PIP) family protein YhgE
MGALIMMKVPNMELSDVVTSDFAMEKIGHGLIKYVIDSNARVRIQHYDKQLEKMADRFADALGSVDEQLKQFKEFVGKIDADLRVRCGALEETIRNEYVKGANQRVDAKFSAMEVAIKQYSSAIGKNLVDELQPKFTAIEERLKKQESSTAGPKDDPRLVDLSR